MERELDEDKQQTFSCLRCGIPIGVYDDYCQECQEEGFKNIQEEASER